MKEEFEHLLGQCTFLVSSGSSQGTGFAVSPTLLLTCRHVVEGAPVGEPVLVVPPGGGAERTAHVLAKLPADSADGIPQGAERWPDLALLEVAEADAFPHSVVLDAARPAPGAPLSVAGFPANEVIPFQTRHYTAGSGTNLDAAGNRFVQLSGESIDPGQSGAPVLTEAGFVIGYVRVTRGSKSPLGGFFVPLGEVLGEVEQLRELYARPGSGAAAWLEHIDAFVLKDHGRHPSGDRFVDEEVAPVLLDLQLGESALCQSGEISEWTVETSGPAVLRARLGVGVLGEGVLEALDHWSRRHQLGTKRQVEMLGRVLLRGLLPDEINHYLGAMDKHEPPLVRLQAAGNDPLTAIPWEYADGLATSPDWAFTRYVPCEKPPVVQADTLRALVVVNALDGIDAGVLAQTLESYLGRACRRIAFTVRHSLNISEFSDLARAGWDVVHFIGTGWSDGALGFPEQYADQPKIERIEWPTFAAGLVAARARLVVLQVGSLRFELDPTLSTFLDVLEGESRVTAGAGGGTAVSEVRALVLGQHVTTSDHVMKLSGPFYESLDRGGSVERAVQSARIELFDKAPASPASNMEKDHAAFGTVSVVTTAEGNIRLLKRERLADEGRVVAESRSVQPTQEARPAPVVVPRQAVHPVAAAAEGSFERR